MKTRYGLIRHNNPDKFVTDVNAAMKDGWILVGGVSVMQEPITKKEGEEWTAVVPETRPVYAQAMILRGLNGVEIAT